MRQLDIIGASIQFHATGICLGNAFNIDTCLFWHIQQIKASLSFAQWVQGILKFIDFLGFFGDLESLFLVFFKSSYGVLLFLSGNSGIIHGNFTLFDCIFSGCVSNKILIYSKPRYAHSNKKSNDYCNQNTFLIPVFLFCKKGLFFQFQSFIICTFFGFDFFGLIDNTFL
ncbi:MAG: hypothetical protein OMM_04297 [Candidatus Magnetoglobus multicellularis str. Araruama]|uniref:Uncharacterized protein n=1 Tax=Candidatus Magnetoglobus multicellularis str. Araruama TaxID=890399 RepID=A0A1V1P258_9BACT|nr:MAG: hypothetical protein OMM_04297 [Candidatus Magnetoglobus multicellularis str. Araruama]